MSKELTNISLPTVFKIAVVGSSSVGKTSIVRRYIENNFSARTEATIGAQFCSKTVDVYPDF